MKSPILATALLAGVIAVPLAASAASYAPTAPTAAVTEAADSQRTDVHYRYYRPPAYGYYWGFLPPYRYGYHSHRHRYHGKYDNDWRSWHQRRHDRDWDSWDRREWNWKQKRGQWR
jgi:hypothetical protein